MMATTGLGIAASLCVSLFGIKSLLIFSTNNGTVERLAKATNSGHSHSGRKLTVLTTNGRFPGVDQQLNAVCVFYLVYCEDWSVPETSLAGLSCVAGWAVMWALIMLDSLRMYSQQHLLFWIWLPGIFIFNYTAAAVGPLYFAFRLALTPIPTADGLVVGPGFLKAFPWAFVLGFVVPIIMLCLPGITLRGINSKHTLAGWYQQWHLYISFFYYLLPVLWGSQTPQSSESSPSEVLLSLRSVYTFIFTLAVINHWIPILAALAARAQAVLSGKKRAFLQVRELFFPANPFKNQKAKNISEGMRWLIQWDNIISAMATIVWAATLFFRSRQMFPESASHSSLQVGRNMLLPGLLGGPMGIAVALLWWRDELVLGAQLT